MAQLKDLLVNGKSKFLDMVTAVGMRLATGGSDTTFWNTNGGTNTASEIVSAGISGGLTMANDNIQLLSGSTLKLNNALTGSRGGLLSMSVLQSGAKSGIAYFELNATGDTAPTALLSMGSASGANIQLQANGGSIYLYGQNATLAIGKLSNSTGIGIDSLTILLGTGALSGSTPYNGISILYGSIQLKANGGSGTINMNGLLMLSGGYDTKHYLYGDSLTVGCSGVNGSINLYSSGTYGSINLTAGTYGSINLTSTSGSIKLSTNAGIAISAGSNGSTYISGNGHKIAITTGSMNITLSNTGSLNINDATGSGTTYLWGSVIARNTGIKLATSGSSSGCTMAYDATEECVKYTFS